MFSVMLERAQFHLDGSERDVRFLFKCIFYWLWRHQEEAGPFFAASSGAKDSLMLISMHLSPWAASCLPQHLIHFLFFLRFSSPSPLCFFSASFFFGFPTFWSSPSHMTGRNKGNGNLEEMAVSCLCYHTGFVHPICFWFFLFTHFLLHVYRRVIYVCRLGKDKMMTVYNQEKKSLREWKEGDL